MSANSMITCEMLFNHAFDAEGSGELSFTEFKEVCKFLGKPTTESDIQALFQHADADRSGILDFDEVAVAIMGHEAATKHGLMNSLTKANDLVDSVAGAFASFKGSLAEMGANADQRARYLKNILSKIVERTF